MLRRFLSTLALTALPFAATANELVTTFTLDNGMDVIVVEDHRAPVVQHMVWYRAGSADEPPGKSGIAHFLEHLLFKATDTLEAGEFSSVVSANGGTDNAFTSYDYTAYFQRVAADRLGLMMKMEADRMKNIRLTDQDILAERQVIIEERNQRTENSPGGLFNEQMNAAQYRNHRYGIPIIGWKHEMSTLTMEDAYDFYRLHYSPNNAILVVSGDVTPDEVRVLADRAEAAGACVIVTLPSADHPRNTALVGHSAMRIFVPDAAQGMSVSVKAGIKAVPSSAPGVMILPGDMPGIETSDMVTLWERFEEVRPIALQATTQDGQNGHPIIFSAAVLHEFHTLSGDRGAFRVLKSHEREILKVPLRGQRARLDLDTPEDWHAWRSGQLT